MEVYFKDLISKETSLEKLVDDLTLVVQGADSYASAIGSNLSEHTREQFATRLQRLKERCHRLSDHVVDSASATDRMLRQHPYSFLAIVFAAGWLIGRARRKS